ncbi:hypothetical protein FNJ88_03835 [Chryseobacterium sp. SNU WT5]|uniref:DUF6759 domain-containing protein n=1 Tax=Chryseobacterium sp. SNU WT5 TaxID=2594269 RepID=UPI00117D8DEC|nr:DUF6759 domain-containing protein [Chryseobacterium sp. SNU WT5]QDP84721.1 hypothetical protein FNJ88_03835 [Chryseobacterium sp. SNU WT5]
MQKIYLLFCFTLLVSCNILPSGNTVYRSGNSYPQKTPTVKSEINEFAVLMEKDKINKKHVNAEVLTHLLNDPDPNELNTAAVIDNTSNCDIIIRIVGIRSNEIYNLPIPRNSKNQFIIKKGTYTLKSNICGANYYSQKNIIEPLILKLSTN